ncbi:MAG TPA: hypothetical protein VGJ05_00875 [Fimbriiglobus sp.]|jgi:hypothetical protein
MPTTEYLVRYGRPAFVGRFRDPDGRTFARGASVAVRTPRGLEPGEVLATVTRFEIGLPGDLVGPHAPVPAPTVETDLLADAQARVADLPVAVLDCEQLLDPVAVLHVAAWDACDLTPILDELSATFGLAVRVHHLGEEPVPAPDPPTGCGKPDCGQESGGGCGSGGGCSSGSCSRGTVKDADDLTAYFSNLRTQMEAQGRVALN